jgi:hypothetical protein
MANVVSHGACGIQWTQVGNQTGHCSGCHLTFSGEWAFDRHQSIIDGRVVCKIPSSIGLVAREDKNVAGSIIWGQATSHRQRSLNAPVAAVTREGSDVLVEEEV